LRLKIVVHDFSKYDPRQSVSGNRCPEPRIYSPRPDQTLFRNDPVEILLFAQHYYPIFKFGTFPDTSLPHYHGKDFVASRPQWVAGEAEIGGTSTAADPKKELSPNLMPDPAHRQEAVPATHLIQSVKQTKSKVHLPGQAIKSAEGDNKVVISEVAKPDLKPLNGQKLAVPPFNVDPPQSIGSVAPQPETCSTGEPTLGQNILKGLVLAAGGSIIVGGLVAIGHWLHGRFFKTIEKPGQVQRMMREVEEVAEQDDEGSGDETVATAKW
jgi:hypothetical protein